MSSATDEFLLEFHRRHVGATPEAIGHGRLASGISSYELLARLVRPGDRVLDLACGDGHLREALPERISYVGVDMSEADLERARSRFPGIDVRAERAQRLSLADGSIDVALCHMALMLVSPLEPALDELARVLAPSGVIGAVIGGPLAGDEAFSLFASMCREATARGELERLALGDRRLRSADTIAPLFSSRGFEVEIDDDWLVLDGDVDAVLESLALTYDVARMNEALRARFEAEFRERAGALADGTGTVPYRLCVRTLVARRPSAAAR